MNKKMLIIIMLILMNLFSVEADDGLSDMAIGEAEDPPIFLINAGESALVDIIGEIQQYSGQFENEDDRIWIEFSDLNVGDTIYAYAAGQGRVDTYLSLFNEALSDVFVEDDNTGGARNASLSFEVEVAGTYIVELISRDGTGAFQLFVGVNTPELLSVQDRVPQGEIVVDFEPFDCELAEFGDRPVLSGRNSIYEADDFVIHYTRTGRDRATQEWIDELAIALELSLDMQLNTLGWALPPSDCGEGGDTRLDVYVLDIDIESAVGFARPENIVGDNPNTDVIEYYGAYSFLLIENDIDGLDEIDIALNELRTTAAHEIHHNIQFGYDVNDRFFGFYEAGATWIETLVYPDTGSAGASVSPVFSTPDICIGAYEGRGSGDSRIYGEWILIDSFTRDLGIESYQFIWEVMAEQEGLEGFYYALDALGTTPQEVVLRMAVRNLLLDYNLSDQFDDTVRIENTISDTGLISPSRNGVQPLGVDYLRIRAKGLYQFDLLDGENLNLYLVGIDEANDTAQLYELGSSGTVDTTAFSQAYLMVINQEQHSYSDACDYTDWLVQVSVGDVANLTESTGEVWDASKFALAK